MEAAGTGASVVGGAAGIGQAIAQSIPSHRQCHIFITNECASYFLSNPRWYTYSGGCAVPFPPTIRSNASGDALFTKTRNAARGAVGVVTYDLFQNGSDQTIEKLAIMFSNPYNFHFDSNWYAVGIFDGSRECDKSLYNEMYSKTSTSFVKAKPDGSVLTYQGSRVTIKAVMSNSYQPVMKMELSETK